MSDVSKLNFGDNGGDRNVKDAVAREKLTVVDPTEGEGLITFGVDAQGNYGYKKVGADTVTPFKTGGGTTEKYKMINFSGSNTYQNIYMRNFYIYTHDYQFELRRVDTNNYRIIYTEYSELGVVENRVTESDITWGDLVNRLEYYSSILPEVSLQRGVEYATYFTLYVQLKINIKYITTTAIQPLNNQYTSNANSGQYVICSGATFTVSDNKNYINVSSYCAIVYNET